MDRFGGWFRVSGALSLMLVSSGLRAVAAPVIVNGFGTGTVTTNQGVSITAQGVAPYTYAWTVYGDPTIFATTPSGQTTFFRRNGVSPGETYSATAFCTVSDASGQAVQSNEITANISGL